MESTNHLYSKSAEQSLIGGLIATPEEIGPVLGVLRDASHFYDFAHQEFFKVIKDLHESGLAPDMTVMAERLKKRKILDDCGGPKYLAECFCNATVHSHVELARTVIDLSVRRNAVKRMYELAAHVADRSRPTYTAINAASRDVAALAYPLLESDQGDDGEQSTYRPFPLDALHGYLAEFIDETSKATPCDTGLLVLPTLVTLGACIGGSRVVEIKQGWYEQPCIWGCVIAHPSSKKTVARNKVIWPLWDIEADLAEENDAAERTYNGVMASWKSNSSGLRGEEAANHAHSMPSPPAVKQLVTSDITIESLQRLLADNPRGIVCMQDELRAWFKSMGKYTQGGGGGEESKWLEFWGGGRTTIHRRGDGKKGCSVPNLCVPLYGTIQPRILAKMFGEDQFDSGLIGRFLWCYPPYTIDGFNELFVHPDTLEGYKNLCQNLWADDPGKMIGRKWTPAVVPLSPAARRLWYDWHEAWQKHVVTTDGELQYAVKKLEQYCARLALIMAVTQRVWSGQGPWQVSEKHLKSAIRMIEWFEAETVRVYSMMKSKPNTQASETLLAFVKRCGGEVTIRRLMRGDPGKYPDRDVAQKALDRLVSEGKGKWEYKTPGPQGGTPTRTFVMSPALAKKG